MRLADGRGRAGGRGLRSPSAGLDRRGRALHLGDQDVVQDGVRRRRAVLERQRDDDADGVAGGQPATDGPLRLQQDADLLQPRGHRDGARRLRGRPAARSGRRAAAPPAGGRRWRPGRPASARSVTRPSRAALAGSSSVRTSSASSLGRRPLGDQLVDDQHVDGADAGQGTGCPRRARRPRGPRCRRRAGRGPRRRREVDVSCVGAPIGSVGGSRPRAAGRRGCSSRRRTARRSG